MRDHDFALRRSTKPATKKAAPMLASAAISRVAAKLRAMSQHELAQEAECAAALARRMERTLDEIAADAMEDAPRVVVQFPCEQGRH